VVKDHILQNIVNNVEKVIVGKRDVVEKVLVCLISGGHLLIEDTPGTGKTLMVQSIAKSINCSFKRIQFTPDLLPSDITGISVFNQKLGEFEFKQGPVMSNMILADEINRTSPKTQSSLLEVMSENQVTCDGITYRLKSPFMVFATQNPVEYEGTFPLPEAQLDRFMMKINMGYPSEENELLMMHIYKNDNPMNSIEPVAEPEDIEEIKAKVMDVYVDEKLERYILGIIRQTREKEEFLLGASPRATLGLYRASQSRAFMNGREYVTPDDVKAMVKQVICHRIILKPEWRLKGVTSDMIIDDIIKAMPIPGMGKYA
jgi:MoxR-like ATPase